MIRLSKRVFYLNLSRMTAAQSLKTTKHKAADFLSFLYNNVPMLAMIAIGYLITRLAFASIWAVYFPRKRKEKWFPFNLLFLSADHVIKWLPKLSILMLSYAIFKFIIVNMLRNTIKSDTVVVDTSFLIDSAEKLETTNKRPIFFGSVLLVFCLINSGYPSLSTTNSLKWISQSDSSNFRLCIWFQTHLGGSKWHPTLQVVP